MRRRDLVRCGQYRRSSPFQWSCDAGEGAIRAVASAKNDVIRWLIGLVIATMVLLIPLACSGDDAGQAESGDDGPTAAEDAATDAADASDGNDANGDSGSETDSTDSADGADTTGAADRPTLADEGHASIAELAAGEQIEDAQGNLIAIYGFAVWPTAFADLPATARSTYPFFGDVEAARDAEARLVVIDIGMCSAGIDADGSGTAEFFLHGSAEEVLSTDLTRNRGVITRHPVVQPGFRVPGSATCERGYLPVFWTGEGEPGFARYVLATRASADADIERHIYQWPIDGDALALDPPDSSDGEVFAPGQIVTFNDGRLVDSTVEVDGWAEQVGAASELDGTRVVSVSLSVCPASPVQPEFGLAVDGWNIVAPLPGGLLDDLLVAGEDPTCAAGWLDFAVPFGGVPTGFFVSDGASSTVGYAEWSLDGAALPVPQ